MSIAGLEQLMVPRIRDCCHTWSNLPHTSQCEASMGYVPKPPPMVKVRHTLPSISAADDATFDAWMKLPYDDHRTLDEYAANPVLKEFTWEMERPPGPPPPPPSTPPSHTGYLKQSWGGVESFHTGSAIIHPLPPVPEPVTSFGPPPDSGSTFREVRDRPDGPKNRSIREGSQILPDKPWPRK